MKCLTAKEKKNFSKMPSADKLRFFTLGYGRTVLIPLAFCFASFWPLMKIMVLRDTLAFLLILPQSVFIRENFQKLLLGKWDYEFWPSLSVWWIERTLDYRRKNERGHAISLQMCQKHKGNGNKPLLLKKISGSNRIQTTAEKNF